MFLSKNVLLHSFALNENDLLLPSWKYDPHDVCENNSRVPITCNETGKSSKTVIDTSK